MTVIQCPSISVALAIIPHACHQKTEWSLNQTNTESLLISDNWCKVIDVFQSAACGPWFLNRNHQDRRRWLWPRSSLSEKLLAIPTFLLLEAKLCPSLVHLLYSQILNSKWIPRGHCSSHLQKIQHKTIVYSFYRNFKIVFLLFSTTFSFVIFQKLENVICEDYFMLTKCCKSQCWSYLCEWEEELFVFLCYPEYPLSRGVC